MGRVLTRIVVVVSAFALGGLALADDATAPQKVQGDKELQKRGVVSVTDANGTPIDLRGSAAPPKPETAKHKVTGADAAVPTIQRGQAWWPYAEPLARPAVSARTAATLREEEIDVNGVVTIDVRDPQAAMQKLPKELLVDQSRQTGVDAGYYLVKIRGLSRTQHEVDALEGAGAVLGEYLNVNTYIAKIPTASVEAVRALPFVTYVGDYQPAYKISPLLGLQDVPVSEAYDQATGRELPWVLEIVLHKGATPEDVLSGLARLSLFPDRNADIFGNDAVRLIHVRSAPDFIPMLAQIPGVKWIAEKPYPRLLASGTSPNVNPMLLQNNGVFTTNKLTGWKLWNAGIDGNLNGTAQIVTMMDTGLNTNAYHFSQDTVTAGTLGAAHRKVVGYDVYGGDQCVNNSITADGGHGTETSQHAVGSISNMSTNPDTVHTPNENWDDGIARDGKVYFQDIGNAAGTLNPPVDLGPAITAAIAKGSFIQNHSWGAATATYDSQASLLDTAIFNNPNFIVTASAGNNGILGTSTIDDVCTAKNSICVGGADPGNPNLLFENCAWDGTAGTCSGNDLGSSRGPVLTSGRVKPDIVTYMANWTSIGGEFEAVNLSHQMCQTDATKTPYWDYVNNSGVGGTSFSAPETAGLAALVRDYFLSGFYPSGAATPANAVTPSGSLVKAVILASGENMGTTGWPDTGLFPSILQRYSSDVGFGRANLPAALHIGAGAPFLWIQNNDNLGDGSTKKFFYTINNNATPLRVMLVWYDAAGNALQKDADLKVIVGANTYLGNVLSGGWSTTGGSADRANTTEGVFLDSAHGLPASGTVEVDVVGFNDPAGMNYSLVVVGDVASQSVTQVSFDSSKYSCNKTMNITVNDTGATSPVSVTVTSRDSGSNVIDTKLVSCSGSNGEFNGSIIAGSGITVADGGTVTATYAAATPSVANIVCKLAAGDGGYILNGGCDNSAAGTDQVAGPLTNSGQNEFYTRYMDAGENTAYTFGFTNQTGAPLSDVYVNLSFSGPGAGKMTVLNNPVHVGAVPVDALTGAVFQVRTDNTTTGLTSVNMDFDITSTPDGFTTPKRLTQVQLLQANDVIVREKQCTTFNTSLGTFFESTVNGHPTNPWKWIGSATAPSTVGSENRVDGICSNNTANAGAMIGNSAITSGNNFTGNADSVILQRFQPLLLGNGPSGQPYHYAWKWHSFYHASETNGATTGVWGAFYNDQWNQAVNPTGDQATNFPISLAYFYQTVFDYPSGVVGSWNWELSNTGTPDDPRLSATSTPVAAPNQIFITFNNVTGLASASTWFSYGQEHADLTVFGGTSTVLTRRDVAFDNDNLVYDEYYAAAQTGASCASPQVGLVAFDRYAYNNCPTSQAVISVTDANAVGPLTVTVSSPGTGDTEQVTLTGSAPYFTGTVNLSTDTIGGVNDGTLLVLPNETITVAYTDASPAATSTASAQIGCTGGNVVLVSHTQVSDNGDNDGIPDNNETVTMDLTIQNNGATDLNNVKVELLSHSANIDCVGDAQALYGTVAAGATATNPPSDRFKFHVASSVACADWQNAPKGQFTVLITADGVNGAQALQTFTLDLDLDNQSGGAYTFSQNFTTNPGWQTGTVPSDNGPSCDTNPYVNDFHWCAACGNAGGGYGAWIGNAAFGTAGQNYTAAYENAALYSPIFTANGPTTLQFQVAYRTEPTFDGAIVQYQLNNSGWTLLGFTTPAQAATTASNFCSPIAASTVAWTGNGVSWTTTNIANIPSANGNTLQFRWRLGGDTSVNGTSFGGLGVDNVTITNLLQTQVCEPTRNTLLPGCSACASAPDGTPCDDSNPCTQTDTCQSGACVGSNPVPVPGDVGNTVQVNKSGTDANLSWTAASNATTSDGLRGNLSALPVGPGGGDELCFPGIGGTLLTDTAVPAPGTGFWYLIRGHNSCQGGGTYGNQGVNGSPGALRVSTTCP
ncbi:MAG TPA: hypothetical protein VFV19_17315 [Candidatus Polarisedimenticolaceae bacterium]|nr:hypothetical protein [Candidatus Polarisedimenticolaceae bacterium]